MSSMNRSVAVGLPEALEKGPPPAGNLAVPVFAHGTLEVELYTPVGCDLQKPHRRDEIYFTWVGIYQRVRCFFSVFVFHFLSVIRAFGKSNTKTG